jgi:N-acetylmuramoyl-L-alanine amidase
VHHRVINLLVFIIPILLACALLLTSLNIYAATVIASSILPTSEYTRITIETDQAISYSMLVLKSPDRIVLDIKNIQVNQPLKTLTTQTLLDDSVIKQVRVAKFQLGITRIVVDLKTVAMPKLSVYKPTGEYQHRLALDIYPIQNAPITQTSPSEISNGDISSNNSNASESTSSGAKIVLDPIPVFEPDADSSPPAAPE